MKRTGIIIGSFFAVFALALLLSFSLSFSLAATASACPLKKSTEDKNGADKQESRAETPIYSCPMTKDKGECAGKKTWEEPKITACSGSKSSGEDTDKDTQESFSSGDLTACTNSKDKGAGDSPDKET